MRRLNATLAALAATALIAGCGGGSSSDDPLEAALAYLPADTPFAASFGTDLDGDQFTAAEAIVEQATGFGDVRGLLESAIAGSGADVSLEEDIEPALGNPVVFAATDIQSFLSDSGDEDFVGAIKAADGDALDNLVEIGELEEQGESHGATLYGDGFAIEDDVLIFAATDELLEEALTRADDGESLDAGEFEDSFEGLPDEALMDVYFNVGELIDNDPDTEQARSVPWVSALTTFGMTFAVAEDRLSIDFNLQSDGEDLSDEELPLAPGAESPAVVVEPGRLGAALRDPSHIVGFFEETFALLEPEEFEQYEAAKPVIADQFGIDLEEDVFSQLTGDLSVSLGIDGSFQAYAELEDPAAFEETVDTLAEAAPQLGSELGLSGVKQRGDLYVGRLDDGQQIGFGVSGERFVVTSDPGQVPDGDGSSIDGASGSLVLSADAGELASQALGLFGGELGLGGQIPSGILDRLGDLTGSLETSADGMRGSISLTLP